MSHFASHNLFDLIKTMSRSEKRFFKVHIETHSSKHTASYKLLFDRIAHQEYYDEERLKMEFRDIGQRFPVLKHRLLEKVLESLEIYARKNDTVLRLRHELNKAQVLFSRGLIHSAQSQIKNVLEQAEELGLWELQLEADRMQLSYMEVDLSSEGTEAISLENQTEILVARLEMIKEEWKQMRTRAEAFRQIQTRHKVGPGPADTVGPPEKDSSPRAVFLYHHAMSAKGFLEQDFMTSLDHTTACMNTLKAHPYLTKDHKLSMAKMIANGFYNAYRLHDYEKAEELLVSLKVMYREEHDSRNAAEYLTIYLQSKLYLENHLHSYHDAHHLLEMESKYIESRSKLNVLVRSGIDYGYALLYFGIGQRSESLKRLNQVLHSEEISRNDKIYQRALLFYNVLQIEQGDKEWLVHSARSLKRYLQTRNKLGAVETALLKYISDIRRSRTMEGEYRALENYILALRSVRKDPSERKAFEYFDFLRWAEGRMEQGRRGFQRVA